MAHQRFGTVTKHDKTEVWEGELPTQKKHPPKGQSFRRIHVPWEKGTHIQRRNEKESVVFSKTCVNVRFIHK